jgi:NADH-quinone oxidoreductase subunit E
MLTEQETNEINAALEHLPGRQAGTIDALKIVQKHRRYISDETLRDIAAFLDMSPADLDSIATFYNLIFRKPVGEHVIMVCDSVSCWITGEERVLDHLQKKLQIQPGQTTSDGVFTLLPIVCLGHCEQAPVMMLDGEIIGNLTEEKIDQVLAEAKK